MLMLTLTLTLIKSQHGIIIKCQRNECLWFRRWNQCRQDWHIGPKGLKRRLRVTLVIRTCHHNSCMKLVFQDCDVFFVFFSNGVSRASWQRWTTSVHMPCHIMEGLVQDLGSNRDQVEPIRKTIKEERTKAAHYTHTNTQTMGKHR